MTTTTALTAKSIRAAATTPLEKSVAAWIVKAEDKDFTGRFRDLFHGGCASGIVSNMIYYRDTCKFYARHKAAIWELVGQMADDCGETLFHFLAERTRDNSPGDCDQVENFLAWFGFETAARNLADHLELDV